MSVSPVAFSCVQAGSGVLGFQSDIFQKYADLKKAEWVAIGTLQSNLDNKNKIQESCGSYWKVIIKPVKTFKGQEKNLTITTTVYYPWSEKQYPVGTEFVITRRKTNGSISYSTFKTPKEESLDKSILLKLADSDTNEEPIKKLVQTFSAVRSTGAEELKKCYQLKNTNQKKSCFEKQVHHDISNSFRHLFWSEENEKSLMHYCSELRGLLEVGTINMCLQQLSYRIGWVNEAAAIEICKNKDKTLNDSCKHAAQAAKNDARRLREVEVHEE